ncbi:MAG TPA: ABC transporter ATP-binding protein [Mycobacteriales bacterium]|jgi:putative ABC transport system ATP-binding protein|nr:ABC transporter ATP-binding protein [Mycobacteriales bacterium]
MPLRRLRPLASNEPTAAGEPAAARLEQHHRAATSSLGAAVEVTDLRKTYGLDTGQQIIAADHLTLTVQPGSVVAVTGPSGSGKSTLLHLIGAIDRPDSGTIRVDTALVTSLKRGQLAQYRRTVGFVFQRYNLLPALTALDNVLAPVLPYRTSYDKQERARELLAAVGLQGREGSLPSRLSGGQQQRIAIARALINTPRLLLADEPTGNLDSATGADILRLLLDLRNTRGMTILLATHDPAIAAHADRLLRVRDGALIDDIDLTSDPADTSRLTGLG